MPDDLSTSQDSIPAADGGCICNAVRYQLRGPPKGSWICHCLSCRKVSGSICMANIYISKDQWAIVKGADHLHKFTDYNTSSGLPFFAFFCRTCSCLVYTSSDELDKEGALIIPSGSLDEPLEWKPTMEFWCIRRSAWLPPIEGTKQFEKNPQ
ncbi:hypothetical protein OC834_006670 [Tilletia horrida]|nr:hypothetical protein OC834_006670 [Tilletia horrida]KAK0528789.1 hypothetical protein OC835_004534 [Tilletia horrida]KAK0562367.1 hypothetical protein OC844_002739 [Tilletia horrida]